jgi:general secretion pathway protein G
MPTAAEGLGALLKAPPGARNWRGPYISQVNWHPALADPWGNQYRYNVQGAGRSQMYTISSDGPDQVAGTADDLSVQF